MPRPFRCRCVKFEPGCRLFKPLGVPMRDLEEVVLGLDEAEALRLGDLKGLYQEQAAKQMNVSRQTFGNILNSAHRKIADALVNGKSIRIDGGPVEMDRKEFICTECQHKWTLPFGSGRPDECPACQCHHIHRTDTDGRIAGFGLGNRGRRGRCGRTTL